MKKHFFTLALRLTLILGSFAPVQAREIEFWPYDRLRNEADVVVVGVPLKSEDSGEIVNGPLWKTDFIGVNTTLKITGVLRGRLSPEEIVVYTLRAPDDKVLVDGPLLTVFRTEPLRVEPNQKVGQNGRAEYLLFLKKRRDGRWEPVSGPLDSSHAIREMYLPVPSAK